METEMLAALYDGREVDLATLPPERVHAFVKQVVTGSQNTPEAKRLTKALMRSLHAAAMAPDAKPPLAGPGLIVALATQCMRTQGRLGDGMDHDAIAWARAQA